MKRIKFIVVAVLCTAVIVQIESCNTNTFAQGEILYNNFCSNCHMVDGSGLANLIPPIAQSDYLKNNADEIACLIRYGMEGEITVNGILYNAEMPGFKELSEFEIANIINFMHHQWNPDLPFKKIQTVRNELKNCTVIDR
jgi:mono/diheme cytochrome c family protein